MCKYGADAIPSEVFKMKLSARAGWVLFLCTVFTVPASARVETEEFYGRGLFGVTELLATPEALLGAASEAPFLLGSAELAGGSPELATHHLELLILNDPPAPRLEPSTF